MTNKRFSVYLVAIMLIAAFVAGCGSSSSRTPASPNTGGALRVIPYPEGAHLGGAAAYNGANDHRDSRYFITQNDWFEQENTRDLVILPHYATYQQTTGTSCGPAAILTILYHYGITNKNELEIMAEVPMAENGLSAECVRDYFLSLGFKVESHVSSEPRFKSLAEFVAFAREQLQAGRPIMVDWQRWEGHYTVIIGIDSMGTEIVTDDVVIMADPFDISDHLQDGYFVVHALQFYAEWVEGYCGEYTNSEPPYRQAMVIPYQ
ncbi:hypothetical protein IJJ08_00635 [bacterium]|nr:hypothetical protein [bacterium]